MRSIEEEARKRLKQRASNADVDLAKKLTTASFDAGESKRWEEAERLARLALEFHGRNPEPDPESLADAYEALGDALLRSNREANAVAPYMESIRLREAHLGVEHASLPDSLAGLGVAHRVLGNYEEAEALHRRAWAIDRSNFGPTHRETINDVLNLRRVLHADDRLEETEILLRDVLQLVEADASADPLQHEELLAWLGHVLWCEEREEEAEAIYRRVLVLYEKNHGTGHLECAKALMSLGILNHELGRNPEAESLLRRSLKIREKEPGADDRDTLETLLALGKVLEDMERYDEAEDCFRRVTSVGESDEIDLELFLDALLGLGGVLNALERWVEVEDVYRRALAVTEPDGRGSDLSRADALTGLGETLIKLERPEEADDPLRRALKIYEETFAANHPAVALALMHLARCLFLTRQYDACLATQFRELEVARGLAGPQSNAVAVVHFNIACTQKEMTDFADAATHLERAVDIDRAFHGHDHPEVAENLLALGEVLETLGRQTEAREAYTEALRIFGLEDVKDEGGLEAAREALDDLGEWLS